MVKSCQYNRLRNRDVTKQGKGSKRMSKRWIAWTLVCTLLLGCLGGLSVAAAADEPDTLTLPTPSWRSNGATVNETEQTITLGNDGGIAWHASTLRSLFEVTDSDVLKLTVTLDYQWNRIAQGDQSWGLFTTVNSTGGAKMNKARMGKLIRNSILSQTNGVSAHSLGKIDVSPVRIRIRCG